MCVASFARSYIALSCVGARVRKMTLKYFEYMVERENIYMCVCVYVCVSGWLVIAYALVAPDKSFIIWAIPRERRDAYW